VRKLLVLAIVFVAVGNAGRSERLLGSLSSTAVVQAQAAVAQSAPPGGGKVTPTELRLAVRRLARLRVRTAGTMAGYSRARFGPAWEDVDGNGCDTRDDILRRDLVKVVYKSYSSHCVVASGILHDPYTGKTIRFKRGIGTSTAVQIDHVVALADAWRTGARLWSASRRLNYANDPLVLLAVDGSSNEAKSDDDASQWLPPRRAYDCRYVVKQIAIKTKYALWTTAPERQSMRSELAHCR
jgi:hypothetical protein